MLLSPICHQRPTSHVLPETAAGPIYVTSAGLSQPRALQHPEVQRLLTGSLHHLPGELWHDGKQQVVGQTAKPETAPVQGAAQLQGPAPLAGWARTGPTKVCQESWRQGSDDHRLTSPPQRNLLPKVKEKPRLRDLFLGCHAETQDPKELLQSLAQDASTLLHLQGNDTAREQFNPVNLTQQLAAAVKLRPLFCCGGCTLSTLQAAVCSKRGSFGLQGSKEAHFGWEACCYLPSIPPRATALLCHQGGQRWTSLGKDAKFNALFTATNLDTRATEPLDDTPATEEASESPAGGDRLKFCLHGE